MAPPAAFPHQSPASPPAAAPPQILRLADYLTPRLALAPGAIAPWRDEWPAFVHDRLPNSPCIAAAHLSLHLTGIARTNHSPTEDDVIALHTAITRRDPATGNGHHPASGAAVLEHWRRELFCGHRIAAYAALEPRNRAQAEWSIWQLGGIYCSLNLPTGTPSQRIWALPIGRFGGEGESGSCDSHAVAVVGYDHSGLLAVTRGGIKRVTWEFWRERSIETYAVFGAAPPAAAQHGLDWNALEADTAHLGR